MPKKVAAKRPRRGFRPPSFDDHPLLRVLIAEALRRGDTLEAMAQQLGVTYIRVTQWRRKEANISNARRRVMEAAARYLGIPTAYVLCMAGIVRSEDFVNQSRISMAESVQRELTHIRLDPHIGGFFPEGLLSADPALQLFVVSLYREVGGEVARGGRPFEWVRSLQLAAMGDAQAQIELASLRGARK